MKDTGGIINLATVKEQLLYEVTNPYEYITPDVVADFTTVSLQQQGKDCVLIEGGGGKEKPGSLKVSVGFKGGFIGEGEISYAGSNALGRAQLAGDIIQKRLQNKFGELRVDYIGLSSVHPNAGMTCEPGEIRLRIAGKAATAEDAALIGEEVEALYTNGPAAGGGVRKYVNEIVGIVSTLINRKQIHSFVTVKQHG